MRKKTSEVSATAAQAKRTNSSSTIASGTVRQRKTHHQVHNEGFDCGVRRCIGTMLGQGETRDFIAWFFCQDIHFPFTNDPVWKGLWAFDDWDDWVSAGEA